MSRAASRLAIVTIAVAIGWAIAPFAVLATTLTPAPPASATCAASPEGTVCSWDEVFATPFPVPYGVACDGFAVRVNLAGQRDVTAFYDESGVLVRRIRHSTYEGTLINSVTGASVPHRGHFTIFDDLVAGTSTITGMLSRTIVAGEGLVWRNIGRIVMSTQNGAILFEAGEHGTWDVAADPTTSAELCAALS
jgi:hypothetical protein